MADPAGSRLRSASSSSRRPPSARAASVSPSPAGASASWPSTSRPRRARRSPISRERLRQILAEEDDHLPAHQDLEGVTRPAPRGEAGPHRVPARARTGPDLRLRRVRAARDQARGRVVLGGEVQATATSGQLPQAARDQAALRLVLGRRRPPLRPHRAEEGRPPHAAGAEGDPGQRARRRADLRDLGQLEPPPGPDDPSSGARTTPSSSPSPPPTGRGRTRSRRTSARSASSPSPTRTTRATPRLAKAIRDYIRWRNAHTTDPEILALERKHRAMMRGEAQRRWGQPRARAA